jgi:hypothetical protein
VDEEVLAVCGLDLFGCDGASAPEAFERPLGEFAQDGFELGEGLFDRVEIGAVGWEKAKLGAGGFDRDFDGGALVSAEVVHDHDVAGAQRPDQFLFDGGRELVSIDRSIEDAGRGQAVVAQGGDEGRRFSMAEWRVADQPLADRTPPIAPRHIRGRPGFVDENELPRVEDRLRLPPCGARSGDVRTLVLGRAKRFFYS